MRFVNPLPYVANIGLSKAFYQHVMQLCLLEDHGDFVRFENQFALHEGTALDQTIFGVVSRRAEPYGRRNLVLYFETSDIDAAYERIAPQVAVIHPIEKQSWGQRVFRFYDPDQHIVEVGEPQ